MADRRSLRHGAPLRRGSGLSGARHHWKALRLRLRKGGCRRHGFRAHRHPCRQRPYAPAVEKFGFVPCGDITLTEGPEAGRPAHRLREGSRLAVENGASAASGRRKRADDFAGAIMAPDQRFGEASMTATRIYTYDSTLREGEQCEGITLSLADKLAIVPRLDEFGIDYIEGGFPASKPQGRGLLPRSGGYGFEARPNRGLRFHLQEGRRRCRGSRVGRPHRVRGRRWSLSSGRRGTPRWSARCKRRSKRTCA